MNSVKKINKSLDKSIEYVVNHKELYVKNPASDFTRNRKMTMQDVIRQIVSMRGGTLKQELYDLSKERKISVTTSAFVQQRSKISSTAFKALFNHFNSCCKDIKKYRGYRLISVDGTDINCPRNPESENYLTASHHPEGFNSMHVSALYDICNQTYIDIEYQSAHQQDERRALIEMLNRNNGEEKRLFVCDRGYESYNMFAHLINASKVDFVCRVKDGSGAMADVKKLPKEELDVDVSVGIATTQTNEDKRQGRRFIQTGSKHGKTNSPKTHIRTWDFPSPYTLKFRVVRFMLDTGEYETLATSLSREEFSLKELKELYHMRWSIETAFRDLKYSIGLSRLHSKKDDLIIQEIYSAVIMYNYCSRISGSVAVQQRQKCKYAYKVNFVMAIHICRRFYRSIKKDFESLIHDISSYTEPMRPGRHDKRNLRATRFVGFIYRAA